MGTNLKQPLSPKLQEKLRTIYPLATIVEIAAALRISRGTVSYWAKKLKLSKNAPPPKKPIATISKEKFKALYLSKTETAVAKILGVSQPAVYYWAKKFGFPKKKDLKKKRK